MADSPTPHSPLPHEALLYCAGFDEAQRLARGVGQLELARTQELLKRYLPPPPAEIVDVGGGPGIHACWLARQGYEVHLIDAVLLHVQRAQQASRAQPEHPLVSCTVGDARRLDRADASVDAVLLWGPLYHLTASPPWAKLAVSCAMGG